MTPVGLKPPKAFRSKQVSQKGYAALHKVGNQKYTNPGSKK